MNQKDKKQKIQEKQMRLKDNLTKAQEQKQRSLTALWGLNKGISYRFEEDKEKSYTKTVSSGDPIIIYYELAELIVTDISDIIKDTFQEPINVESGEGSFTFKNSNGDGYQVAVPSGIQYVVSLKEVNL